MYVGRDGRARVGPKPAKLPVRPLLNGRGGEKKTGPVSADDRSAKFSTTVARAVHINIVRDDNGDGGTCASTTLVRRRRRLLLSPPLPPPSVRDNANGTSSFTHTYTIALKWTLRLVEI